MDSGYLNLSRIRLLTLAGSIFCMLGLGAAFTWSLFNQPLADRFGWRVEDVAFTFALLSVCLALGTLFSDKLEEKFGTRAVTAGAGLILGLGFLLASRATALWQIYLTAGVVVGLCQGIIYMLLLTNCIKWFPESKGLVAGLYAGAYGVGSIFFKYVNLALILNFGPMTSFAWLAAISTAVIALSALIIRRAPESPGPENHDAALENGAPGQEFTWREMLRTKEAWLLFFVKLTCCMSGLFLISVAKDLATDWVGLDLLTAAGAVTVVAVGNTLGRILLGRLSDLVPRLRVISGNTLGIFISAALLAFVPMNSAVFFLCMGVISFAFGGTVSVFPALTGEFFGLRNMSKNYSFIYQGFGAGAFAGSFLSVLLGGFFNTFLLIMALSLISFLITLRLRKPGGR